MLHRILGMFLLVVLSTDCLVAQEAAKVQGKKLDLAFIPDDAVAALVAHPRRMLTSPQASLWPTEVFSALGKKEVGFDPLELEQVIGVAGLPQGGGPPPVGAILRFRQPVNAVSMSEKIVPDGTDEKVEGRSARLATSKFEPSIVFADERTVLIANPQDLSWMLAAKPGDGPLHKLLQSADDSPTATAYLAMEPMRPLLAGVLPMMQRSAPPMFSDLFDLPMTVDTVQLSANVAGESANNLRLDLKLEAADATTAGNVATVIQRALQDARSLLMLQAAGVVSDDPENRELKEATMKYLNRLGDAVSATLEPKHTGNYVSMKTDLKAGVAEAGVLTGLLLPAVSSARDAARRAQSQNNLKQIALSLHNHHSARREFPPNASYDAHGKPLLSWRVHMLPYLEEQALYDQFHLDEPWDSEHNKKLIEKMPAVYQHPKFNQPGKTLYQAIVGKGAAFEEKDGTKIRSFTDGTSHTILVVEIVPAKAVEWTKPADWEFDPEKQIDMNDFGGLMPGNVFNVAFADGSVRALSRSLDPETLKAMFTRNGGEVVPAQ